MSDSQLNRALASVLNRLLDRFLPPLTVPQKPREKVSLWFSTIAGISTTVLGAVFYGYVARSDPNSFISGFLYQSVNSSPIFRADITPLLILTVIILITIIMFALLIMSSFNRGRPLTFYFWGLTFPALAARIVRLAFESSPTLPG